MTCNKSTNILLLGLASSMKTDIRTSDPNQAQMMTFAYAFAVTIMVAFALVSNLVSIDTFRHTQIRSTSVGIYLLSYSCCSLFGVLMLECRLFQLLDSLTYTPFFIICNVISSLASISTRICIWMIGLIALQRSLHSFEHNRWLNKIRSRAAAPKQLAVVIVGICLMHVHELISRVTLPDPVAENRFVCQIKYSPALLVLNKVLTFIHLLVPFSVNILANCLIMASISRRRATLHQTTYWSQWWKQFRSHGHLFMAPTLAMVRFFTDVSCLQRVSPLFEDMHVASTGPRIHDSVCGCDHQMAPSTEYVSQSDYLLTSSEHLAALHHSIGGVLESV